VEKSAVATPTPRCARVVVQVESNAWGRSTQRGRVAGRRPCPHPSEQGGLGYLLSPGPGKAVRKLSMLQGSAVASLPTLQ
jgi:hypothetical protein